MCGLELILFFIAGWWLMKEYKKHQDFQKQLLDRLQPPAEEEESNAADITVEADTTEADWVNWFTEYFRSRIGRTPTYQERWLAQWIAWAHTSGEEVNQDRILVAWHWERREVWRVLRTLRTIGYATE